jgi:hypothetical protein
MQTAYLSNIAIVLEPAAVLGLLVDPQAAMMSALPTTARSRG